MNSDLHANCSPRTASIDDGDSSQEPSTALKTCGGVWSAMVLEQQHQHMEQLSQTMDMGIYNNTQQQDILIRSQNVPYFRTHSFGHKVFRIYEHTQSVTKCSVFPNRKIASSDRDTNFTAVRPTCAHCPGGLHEKPTCHPGTYSEYSSP